VARESFGIVVLEALAAGAEVVASDLPAFVDLLRSPHGPALGGLFRRGDAADLAAAVTAVLRDGVRRQPLAGNRTIRYEWARVAPRIAQVYAAVAPGPAGPVEFDERDRVRRTWIALDGALIRRARRAIELAGPDVRDPSALRVHQAAVTALAAATDGVPQTSRERAESDLSRRLARADLAGLRADHDEATLARRLHNDAVAAAVRTRRPASVPVRAFEMAES
jgi:phosphatidylinositol alpha-mannosyltransferase